MRFSFLFLIIFLPAAVFAQVSNLAKNHDSSKPVEVTADALEVQQEKEVAIFSGNVLAVQGDLKIKADKMLVYYRGQQKEKNSENAVSRIVCIGNVFVTSRTETAKGKQGLFDVDNNLISLTGNVVLTNGKNVVKGDKLVYNITTGQSKLTSGGVDSKKKGRVKGVFVPQ